MKAIFVIFLAAMLSFGCAHKSHKPESNVNVTKSLKGHKYGNIYFSGQPGGKAIKELREEGFAAVINMRQKNEGKYQEFWEQGAVGGQDIAYYNLPYSMKEKLSDEYLDSVTEVVKKHRKEGKILIHCGSGNRAALWAGAHFQKDHGFSKEEAMDIAQKLGITSPRVETKLVEYLERK
jgi:protein tyrosine phosphatase (PTP) superfamily phosphohydrolase (DUF442 family)